MRAPLAALRYLPQDATASGLTMPLDGSSPFAAPPPPPRYPKRALAAFLLTVVVAPLIGCLPVALPMAVNFSHTEAYLRGFVSVEAWWSFSTSIIAAAYGLGILPALLAAVPVCLIVWRRGEIGYLPVIGIAVVACLLAAAVAIPALQLPPQPALFLGMLGIGPAVLAAVVVRWLTTCILAQRFAEQAPSHDGSPPPGRPAA